MAALATKIQAIFFENDGKNSFFANQFLEKVMLPLLLLNTNLQQMRGCFNDNFLLSSYRYKIIACLKHM